MNPNAKAFPRMKKFFFCLDLKLGVCMVLIMEVGLWGLLSVVALDNEAEFFHSYDLYKFEEFIEDNWYFEMIFGLPVEEDEDYEEGYEGVEDDEDGIDIEYRSHSIAVNGFLMMTFIGYFILTMVFLIGIAKENTNFFIPYIIFDTLALWFSFMLIIGGLFLLNFILIRNCLIFLAVKLYPSLCNYSLFRKMGGKFQFERDSKKTRREQNYDKNFTEFEIIELNASKVTDV